MSSPLPSISIDILKELPKLIAKYRKPNSKKATLEFLLSVMLFLVFLVTGYIMATIGYYRLIPFCVILSGFFLLRIFVIQHDCSHQSFTRYKKLNNIIGRICSFLTFIPYEYRGKTHAFHHNHANKLREYRDIGDINTLTVEEFNQLSSRKKFTYRVFRNPFVLFTIVPTRYLFVHVRLPLDMVKGRHKEYTSLIVNNITIVGFYALLLFFVGYKVFLLVHLPILILFIIIAFWFFYIQHQYEFNYKAISDKWEYVRAAVEGSSFYDLPKFRHRMTANIGYHHIHHLNASIPSYQLAHCFKENPILEQISRKLTFKKSLSSLWNHLRDESQQKMISFREYYRKYTN